MPPCYQSYLCLQVLRVYKLYTFALPVHAKPLGSAACSHGICTCECTCPTPSKPICRWHKHGRTVLKGHSHPRTYYKCTEPGCPMRKHVEMNGHDDDQLVITYGGMHNHPTPATGSRGSRLHGAKGQARGTLTMQHTGM